MLTQAEADSLIQMQKVFANPRTIFMRPGLDETHELIGDNREKFLLDLWRGMIRLSKIKYQTRGRKVIILVRLDIDGSPHSNPDGQKIQGSHLHVYREGYEDKWAFPLDPTVFNNPSDINQTFHDFCQYCNINEIPPFQVGLL
jgi:hypothetical protein